MIETPRKSKTTQVVETAFPLKLHIVLDEGEKQGFDDVISWQGNNAFMVHRPKKFEESVMKEYFNQTQYKDFQKQLELHGFTRLAVGERFGGSYTHSLFLRGKPNMGRFMIQSTKPKKAKLRRRSSAPLMHHFANAAAKGLHQSQSSSHHESGLAMPPPTITSMDRRITTGGSPTFHGCHSALSIEDDLEPLPHDTIEGEFPVLIECYEHDRRSSKKHRSNNSWSPNRIARDDSVAATLDWLSSAFGGTEETPQGVAEESVEIFHKIIDVEEDDDTHSIHSFSSLPMQEETVSSTPPPLNQVLDPKGSELPSSSSSSSSASGYCDSLRTVGASLQVLRSAETASA